MSSLLASYLLSALFVQISALFFDVVPDCGFKALAKKLNRMELPPSEGA
jgi:hypothetical protein